MSKRLMVGQQYGAPALDEMKEVAECQVRGQQLPVEGAVAGLRGCQLPREKTEWFPVFVVKLL